MNIISLFSVACLLLGCDLHVSVLAKTFKPIAVCIFVYIGPIVYATLYILEKEKPCQSLRSPENGRVLMERLPSLPV